MSDREFAVLHNGEEIFRGTEDEFGEQCEYAADNVLGPLGMTDKEFQQYIVNPYEREKQ